MTAATEGGSREKSFYCAVSLHASLSEVGLQLTWAALMLVWGG